MATPLIKYNLAAGDAGDWSKDTFDFPPEIKSAAEFATWLGDMGWTVEKFKALPAYYLALDSDDQPSWLKDL